MSLPSYFMVFDCESVGLHGETFAVGWVVVNPAGEEQDHGQLACDPINASGSKEGREWVAANVPVSIYRYSGNSGPMWIRDEFWHAWTTWKERGAVLGADCPWPVEARFLIHCVQQDPDVREWGGPYPLIDVASVQLAAGFDPLATVDRLPDELPVHDPLADARQSARLLVEALKILESRC
jgi:hypothetical protein